MSHIALATLWDKRAFLSLIEKLETATLSAVLTDIFGMEILTLAEYAEKYGEGMTVQGVAYAMDKDLLDYIQLGGIGNRNRFVVMTEKTQTYTPNKHPARGREKVAPATTKPEPPTKPAKGGKKEIMST